ncbi:virulence protein E, partial [Massilia sp. CCM 8695]|nr:virulence protein E [Massilia frigida]
MSDVSQVVAQMIDHDMPGLPVGHPILDAKYHRFGKGKKAWYILRETTLRSGRTVVTGAFGFFVGENRNTVPVKVDTEVMTDEERADYSRRQRAAE